MVFNYILWKNVAQRENGAVLGDYKVVIYGRITVGSWGLFWLDKSMGLF